MRPKEGIMIPGVQHFPSMKTQCGRADEYLWCGASAYAQLCERDAGPIIQGQVLVRGNADAGGNGLDGPDIGEWQSSKVPLNNCNWTS